MSDLAAARAAAPPSRVQAIPDADRAPVGRSRMRGAGEQETSLRKKVTIVGAGNTGALMAVSRYLLKTLAGVDRPAERFRVLNGLDAHAQVKVRDRVKIVVD